MSTLFDKDGVEYDIVEIKTEELVVHPLYVGEYGDVFRGNLEIVPKSFLFEVPPSQKINEDIVQLKELKKNLKDEISKCKEELKATKEEIKERLQKVKQHKALKQIEDYIDGKITHYVEYKYGPPEIIAFADTESEYNCGRTEMKLLALFGVSGDLQWMLNQYGDGSVTNINVIPCTSHSEAVNIVAKLINQHGKDALDPDSKVQPSRNWIHCAENYGLFLPQGYHEKMKEIRKEKRRDKIVKLQTELANLQNEEV